MNPLHSDGHRPSLRARVWARRLDASAVLGAIVGAIYGFVTDRRALQAVVAVALVGAIAIALSFRLRNHAGEVCRAAGIALLTGAVFAYSILVMDRRALQAVVAVALAGVVAIALSFRLRNHAGEVSRDAGIALLTGAVLGLVIYPVEEDRVEREVRRDNVRFVREVAIQADGSPWPSCIVPNERPFAKLDLREAVVRGLNLPCADFQGAKLAGADLTSTDLPGAFFQDADLAGAILAVTDLKGAIFIGADLRGANLGDADLTAAGLGNAELEGADLRDAVLTSADLFGADFTGADLREADLTSGRLNGADFTGADLRRADLTGAVSSADLRGAVLTGADLRGAVLTGADLTNVIYDRTTTWPEGFDPPPSAGA